jgi:hypothetical protein
MNPLSNHLYHGLYSLTLTVKMNFHKAIRFVLLLFLVPSAAIAQDVGRSTNVTPAPTQIQAIEEVQLPENVYADEAARWGAKVHLNANDENAWLNLYKAVRYSAYTAHSDVINAEKQHKLDDLLVQMKEAVPNSFAFHYAAYLNGNKTDDAFIHLKTAYQLHPDEHEILDDLLCEAVIRKDMNEAAVFAKKLSEAGIYNSAEVEYNRNVFGSIEQNAVLITNGNVDTYPLVMMQQLQNFRQDVTIICLDWLANGAYSKEVASTLGLPGTAILTPEKILSSKIKRPLYLSLTLPPEIIKKHDKHLYCTGLAMKYSRSAVENLPSLSYNWENLFTKNNLQSEDGINRNYVLPLILLRSYYASVSNPEKEAEVAGYLVDISTRFALTGQLKKRLE